MECASHVVLFGEYAQREETRLVFRRRPDRVAVAIILQRDQLSRPRLPSQLTNGLSADGSASLPDAPSFNPGCSKTDHLIVEVTWDEAILLTHLNYPFPVEDLFGPAPCSARC